METSATFRLWGSADLTAGQVTRRLGIQPSLAFEAGTPVSRRSTATREHSLWSLASAPHIEAGVDLDQQLHRLLAVLEPLADRLWELVDTGYEANWYCWIASHATEHAAELDRDTLRRILALPGDLWLDACGDDNDE